MRQLLQKILLSTCISLFALSMFATDIKTFIPADASIVASVNMKEIKSKAIFDSILNIPIVKKMERGVLREISRSLSKDSSVSLKPENLGLNTEVPIDFYMKSKSFILTGKVVGGIANKDLFEKFIGKAYNEEFANNKKSINGYSQITVEKGVSLSWNAEIFIIHFYDILSPGNSVIIDTAKVLDVNTFDYNKYAHEFIVMNPAKGNAKVFDFYNYYDSDENEVIINENYRDIRDSIKIIITNKLFAEALVKPNKNILSNDDFKRFSKEMKADLFLWIDYGFYNDMLSISYYPHFSGLMNIVNGIYSGLYYALAINIEKDELNISTSVFTNNKLKELLDNSSDYKVKSNFLKYTTESKNSGYMLINFDSEGVGEAYKKLTVDILSEAPYYGQHAETVQKAIDIIIDQEAIYNLFPGELFIASEGVIEKEVTYIDYVYDDEYNYTEVEKTKTKQIPIFTAMLAVGNESQAKTLLDLSLLSKATTKENGIYTFKFPGNKIPFNMYATVEDGLVFFSNDSIFVHKTAKEGVARNLRLGKEHKKLIRNSAMVMNVDSERSLDLISQIMFSNHKRERYEPKIKLVNDNTQKIIIVSKKPKKGIHKTEVKLQLAENEDYSLVHIFKLIDTLIKM